MTIFRLERREGSLPRWQRWWRAAFDSAKGTEMLRYVDHLCERGHEWLCADSTFVKALEFFKTLPGWNATDPLDNAGPPLVYGPLSPQEEHEALLACSPELRGVFAAECVCPPGAPRSVRRKADLAWRKWVERRAKNLGVRL